MAKSCKRGYYYCNKSKKCKKIPRGYHVMSTGYLMRDSDHKDDKETEGKKKNGNGNGNGNYSNGNGNGNGSSSNGGGDGGGGGVSEAWSAKYKKSIDCDNPKGFSQKAHCGGREKVSEGKNGDHEVAMAQSQLKKSAENIKKIRRVLGKQEKDIPAWMQAKITDTAHDTDAAAGYVDKMDEEVIIEKRDGKSAKSKGYSLRDWFKGGGWKQTGGKYDGKPCAKQPGQKTKPYCRDADDRAAMSKEERNKRAAKKRKEDPNPNRRGAAKNVTQESYSNWRSDLAQIDEIAPALAIPLVAAGGYAAYKGLQHLKKKADSALDNARQNATLRGKPFGAGARQRAIEDAAGVKRGTLDPNMQRLRNSYEPEGGLVDEGNIGYSNPSINGKPILDHKGKPVSYNKAETEGMDRYRRASKKAGRKIYADEPLPEETEIVDEGKKDACYHKVKSRYSVWPSAYASGALVKCRKVGAANWGNKTKKESFSNWREDMLLEGLEDKLKGMTASQIEDLIKANKGAEDKIRETLARMRSATPKPQGKGAQLPNIPKTTETYRRGGGEGRTTYQRGGSDRVSYQRRQTVTRADVQGGTEAAKRAASGQGRYRPGTGVTPDFKLDPKFKPPGSRGMSGRVRPRGRGKLGLALTAASVAAPFVVGAIKKAFNKEDYDHSNWRDNFHATEVESVDLISNEPLQPTQGLGSDMLGEAKSKAERLKEISKQLAGASKMHAKQSKAVAKCADELEEGSQLDEKCWKGYEKKGMKTMFGKRYPNCVKKKKTRKEEVSDWRSELDLQEKEFKSHKMYDPKTGKGYDAETEEDHLRMKKMGYTHEKPEKKNCGCGKDPCETYGKKEVKEDWQKSNRKDGVDGMSQSSVNAYKRENPGSKLKTAVTGKVKKGSKDAKRRKSFCSRSKGQKDMHNIDCSKTPDKKICKARKRWRC